MTITLPFYANEKCCGHPWYATDFAACFDIKAAESDTILPGETRMIATGLFFDMRELAEKTKDIKGVPYIHIFARSGLAAKYSIGLANGVGVIDADYVDEVKILLHNFGKTEYKVKYGDRIAQGMVKFMEPVEFYQKCDPPERWSDRTGGFGSTGISTKENS